VKKYIFFLILSFFTVSGCTFLGGGEDSATGYEDEESFEDSEWGEEGEEEYEDVVEGEGEEEEYEDIVGDEGEEEEYEDIIEGEGEEEKKKGGWGGFFSRLFGVSDEEKDLEDNEFIGEDKGFAEGDRDFEDYKEEDVIGDEGEPSSFDQQTLNQEVPSQSSVPSEVKSADEPKPSFIPLNKIIRFPYRRAGYLVNAVYIARPGDTLESVSQKIYNINQTDRLLQINPHLQSRSVKVGDKIYYNSPLRPDDNSRLLFYYQDVNAPSSVHTLSPGDNIRLVASQLLGHPNSWKEVWATNPELESKGEITESINIVYWPKTAMTVTKASESPSIEEKLVSQQDAENMPEEIPPLEEEVPPPPVLDDKETRIIEPQKDKKVGLIWMAFKQKEIFVALIGIIIALILIIRLILRKRKQKDFDYTATNIDV